MGCLALLSRVIESAPPGLDFLLLLLLLYNGCNQSFWEIDTKFHLLDTQQPSELSSSIKVSAEEFRPFHDGD